MNDNPVSYIDFYGFYTLVDARESLEKQNKPKEGKQKLYICIDGEGCKYIDFYFYTDDQVFSEWIDLERKDDKWMYEIPPCPKSIVVNKGLVFDKCTNPNKDIWNDPKKNINPYHDAAFEMRSLSTSGNHSNQCMYDENGSLVVDIPNAGSADYRATWTIFFPDGHYTNDMLTYDLAKKIGREDDYYSVRPIIYSEGEYRVILKPRDDGNIDYIYSPL